MIACKLRLDADADVAYLLSHLVVYRPNEFSIQ